MKTQLSTNLKEAYNGILRSYVDGLRAVSTGVVTRALARVDALAATRKEVIMVAGQLSNLSKDQNKGLLQLQFLQEIHHVHTGARVKSVSCPCFQFMITDRGMRI